MLVYQRVIQMRFNMVSLNFMVTVVYLIGEMWLMKPGLLGILVINSREIYEPVQWDGIGVSDLRLG